MPLARRLAYAALATALGLLAIEGSGLVLERTLVRLDRTLPTPLPRHGSAPELQVPEGVHLAMVEDATKRWGLQPGSIQAVGSTAHRVNQLGLRGPELGPLADGESRLLTLGDSTIYGDGVQEDNVMSTIAAAALTDAWGCLVTGVIGGVPGYDSAQSLVRLRELGPAVQPDWVVVGAIWSDIFKDNGRQRDDFVDIAALRDPLRRLAAYRVGRTLLAPWLVSRKVRWIASEQDIGDGHSRSRVLLGDYMHNLEALEAHARSLGARTAFLALPAPVDLDAAPVPETILDYRAAMRLVAEQTGSPFIDGPAWVDAEQAGVAIFADQVHPNAFGHALLGHAIAQTLRVEDPPAACH